MSDTIKSSIKSDPDLLKLFSAEKLERISQQIIKITCQHYFTSADVCSSASAKVCIKVIKKEKNDLLGALASFSNRIGDLYLLYNGVCCTDIGTTIEILRAFNNLAKKSLDKNKIQEALDNGYKDNFLHGLISQDE